MGYTKVYAKQFLKLTEDRIIPMVLAGSSNCTMYHNGRYIYERKWEPWYKYQEDFYKTKTEYRKFYEDHLVGKEPTSEWFKDMRTGKWVTNEDFLKWFDSGIKSAKTIEEIRKANPYQYVKCDIVLSSKKESCSYKTIKQSYCRTTEEIINWLEDIKSIEIPDDYSLFYISMGYSGIEPLSSGGSVKDNVKVICKYKSRYIKEFTNCSITYSREKTDAYIFTNKAEFENLCLPVLKRFSYKYTLVKA